MDVPTHCKTWQKFLVVSDFFLFRFEAREKRGGVRAGGVEAQFLTKDFKRRGGTRGEGGGV